MAGRGGLRANRSTNLTASKQAKTVNEPKIAGSSSTQSCQRETMQAASSQLTTKLSTTRLRRRDSFGQDKIKDESGSNLTSSMEEFREKLKGGRVVPSRFREAAAMKKKVVNKIHDQSSGPELKRHNAEKKLFNLHSTGIEESMLVPPDWDLSVMKSEYSPVEVPECTATFESSLVSPTLSEDDAIEKMDCDSLLFSYMAITREISLEKYQENAERNLLLLEEENQRSRRETFEYKQEYLIRENKKQLNSVIEQQMECLKLALPCLQQFKNQYKSLGQALDATRHSLQVRNIHMSDDPREDLENLKVHLRTTEQLLDVGIDKDYSKALAENKELAETVENTDKEIKSFSRKIDELASSTSRETVLHQELDEQDLGMDVLSLGIFK
ncbi:HAUS augmin-like complex subunit 8 [Amblyraja radiata]|uniref:HAUS augmin-like complex subunit 8 n=1 Tax=Amblyraja radiata TaxID=386614 RepID=UPI0014022427|nr:HAUS augmin-like complex subunit 8 [Amblyraja radiata]